MAILPPDKKRNSIHHRAQLALNNANSNNALNLFLEIHQKGAQYEVKKWDGATIGYFNDANTAQIFAKNYRTTLMPTQSITDIRFIPDPAVNTPTPHRRDKAVMTPVKIKNSDFVPIDEENEIVVSHPDNIITF